MPDSRPWYAEFYESDYRQFWSVWPDDPERDARQAEGAIKLLDLKPGQKILDLCCGQGRHCVELARRGYEVTGLDLSESLLTEASERAAEAGFEVGFVQADMREIPFEDEFDAVVSMFTSFGYLESDDEDQKVLNAVAQALKPRGKLLMDLNNADSPHNRPGRNWRQPEAGRVMLETHSFGLHPRAFTVEVTVLDHGQVREHTIKLRAYTADELERMLREAGFAHMTCYGGLDGSPLTVDSTRIVVAAER